MSAPSKIPAIRHAVSALHGGADDGADTRRYAEALQEAGTAVDEAIDALVFARSTLATTLRFAAPDLFESDEDTNEHLAIKRIDQALARVKGGAA